MIIKLPLLAYFLEREWNQQAACWSAVMSISSILLVSGGVVCRSSFFIKKYLGKRAENLRSRGGGGAEIESREGR